MVIEDDDALYVADWGFWKVVKLDKQSMRHIKQFRTVGNPWWIDETADGNLLVGTYTRLYLLDKELNKIAERSFSGYAYAVADPFDASTAYVADPGGKRVLRISLPDLETVDVFELPDYPRGIDIIPRIGIFVALQSMNEV